MSAALKESPQKQLEPHPIAGLLRMMNDAEMASLRADIRAKGLIEPIHLYEGKILDGRNRYAACLAEGVKVAVIEFTGDDPTGFVISKNKERRHLTASQLAVLAIKAAPFFVEDAKKRQRATGKHAPRNEHGQLQPVPPEAGEPVKGESIEQAAKMVGAGRSISWQAARIMRNNPERIPEIELGHSNVSAVYDDLYKKPDGEFSVAAPLAAPAPTPVPRNRKEHRVTAEQVVRKILDDVEPQFRFWTSFESKVIDAPRASEFLKRAAKCREDFSRLINHLRSMAQ